MPNDLPKVAYKTTDPTIVAAWKTTAEQAKDVSNRAVDEAEKIGKNKGLMVQRHLGDQEFVGLAPIDPADPPEGWRYVREQFEPRRGKAGDNARAWLASIQPPSLRKVMAGHGIPPVIFGHGRMTTPGMVLHDDTVLVLFTFEPTEEIGPAWEKCRPSEFYAAQEDAEAVAAR